MKLILVILSQLCSIMEGRLLPWLEKIVLVFAGNLFYFQFILFFNNLRSLAFSDLRLGAQAQTVAMNFKKVSAIT